MFWADEIAQDIKKKKLPLAWVDDMKTPSGRIHVGGFRAVTTHDLVYKALVDAGVHAKFSYVFESQDPMDKLPHYLDQEKYEKYLGMPLFMIPAPEGDGTFAQYYATEFEKGFNEIGCHPQIIWGTELYLSGKMNDAIKKCLDNASLIKTFYEELYKKEMPTSWYPFNVYCLNCHKIPTTRVTDWDGKEVTFECQVDGWKLAKGCGFKGKVSPFATKDTINGKLPWKIEWAAKWQAIGVTVEGAGKDHMTKGGSHDLAKRVAEEVLEYKTPYAFVHEFFLIGGKKMSSSKGMGMSVVDLLELLPPQLIRFLVARTKLNQAIDVDPFEKNTIPTLFDDYQRVAAAYFGKTDPDLARLFEVSQIDPSTSSGQIKKPPEIRFSVLAQWVQMPNMQEEIKKQGLEEWAKYARVYVEKYAPDSEKFLIQKELPEVAKNLSDKQKELLQKIVSSLDKDWDAEDFQTRIYEIGKELGLNGKETFAAIYLSLIGKDHGPKAAWLILSLEKAFVKKRFEEISNVIPDLIGDPEKELDSRLRGNDKGVSSEIFSINGDLLKKYPSISVGVAVIKGVNIEKIHPGLEREKQKVLDSLKGLTTETLGQYPEIIAYRQLYKEMGVDWHSRRPSPEALLRRIALNKGLYTINTCVDAYNLVVMKHRISIGAFDFDTLKFPTEMRFPKEGEKILLLGDSEPTQYTEKELAYFDQDGGFNLDFNYRDSQRTAVRETTKNLYINVDGVYDITPEKVDQSLKEACDLIVKYCGGTIEAFGVERNN